MLPVPDVYIVRLPTGSTGPMLAIFTEVALATFQLKTVEPPAVTLDGLVVKDSIVGSGPGAGGGVNGLVTTTMVERDVEFEPFVASST
jgi:hypothetical protein